MAVLFFVTHEKDFNFHAQTLNWRAFLLLLYCITKLMPTSDAGDYSCKVKYYVDSAWKEFQSTPSHVYIRGMHTGEEPLVSLKVVSIHTFLFNVVPFLFCIGLTV